MNLQEINLIDLQPVIFSDTAEKAAVYVMSKDKNKSAQIRKFYDELSMWHEKVVRAESPKDEYNKLAPFIHMLKAKVAYSRGRNVVDDKFVAVTERIISQIKDDQTLRNAKLFFEALIAFHRAHESYQSGDNI